MKIKKIYFLISLLGLSFNLLSSLSYISSKELVENMDHVTGKKDPKWYLINVLPRYVAKSYNIKDSNNIPVHILDKKLKNSKKWPRNRKIVLYSMKESPLNKYAYNILKNLGFTDIHVLDGELKSWETDGVPLIGKSKLKCFNS